MKACQEMDGLLAERASGEMAAEDAARLDAHLEGCEHCRDELHAYQQTFELARMPAPDAPAPQLDVSTFAAYQRRRRRRVTNLTLGAGFVAAAVAAGVVLAPALLTLRSLPRQPHVAVSDVTSSALAGNDGQMLATSDPTQLASAGDTSSDVVDPEDAALAAFDEAL